MKTRQKPDLLTILALVTILGVAVTVIAQWFQKKSDQYGYAPQSRMMQSTLNKQAYQVNFVRTVSHSKMSEL